MALEVESGYDLVHVPPNQARPGASTFRDLFAQLLDD